MILEVEVRDVLIKKLLNKRKELKKTIKLMKHKINKRAREENSSCSPSTDDGELLETFGDSLSSLS